MGRANPALCIVVADAWRSRPEVIVLRDAGHAVIAFSDFSTGSREPDLILHPAAHAWSDEMFETPYLKTALAAARRRRKEAK